MVEEDYLQILKDFCIARDMAYIKEDLHKNDLKFLYEVLEGGDFTPYSNLNNAELIETAKEVYLNYIDDPFLDNIKTMLKELDTTLYTDAYIDNFIKVFVEKEKLEEDE
jgi:hypothetical protein